MLNLGDLAYAQGHDEKATVLLGESKKIYKEVRDENGIAAVLHLLGSIALRSSKYGEARHLLEQSLEINQRIDVRHGIAGNKLALARLEASGDDSAKALLLAREAEDIYRKLGMEEKLEKTRKLVERLEGKLSADRERISG